MDKKVLNRFVRDFNLPIKVFDEPYFSCLINLYEPLLGSKTKFELLEKTIKEFKSEMDFLEHYYEIRNKIISDLNENEGFKEFNTCDMSKYAVNHRFPTKDVFNCGNIGKYFISIDLVKANFQALKYINPNILLGANSYTEFIGNYTDLEYFALSKYLRQVIFGNINPKRQTKVERYLIEKVLNYLIDTNILNEEQIRSVCTDEIVAELNEGFDKEEVCQLAKELESNIKELLNIEVDIEIYKLTNIGEEKFFVKNFINKDGVDLMCVPNIFFPQAFKKCFNLEINENDLIFIEEGHIAKFLEPIF